MVNRDEKAEAEPKLAGKIKLLCLDSSTNEALYEFQSKFSLVAFFCFLLLESTILLTIVYSKFDK